MQAYRERVASGASTGAAWFEITRVTTAGEKYELRFTLQRVPARLLRISFRRPGARLADEREIRGPVRVTGAWDGGSEYPVWQITRDACTRHVRANLFFNPEDWDFGFEVKPEDMEEDIVMNVQSIGRESLAQALAWLQRKLDEDVRADSGERWRAFLDTSRARALNDNVLGIVQHATKRLDYRGTPRETPQDEELRAKLAARWEGFLQSAAGGVLAHNADALAAVRERLKRAMFADHARGLVDQWSDDSVRSQRELEKRAREERDLAAWREGLGL